jgi:hypothetical protein
MRIAHKDLEGKPERKGPSGVGWKEQFKMDTKEVRWGVDFIQLDVGNIRWLTLVNTVIIFRVPQNMGSFWTV